MIRNILGAMIAVSIHGAPVGIPREAWPTIDLGLPVSKRAMRRFQSSWRVTEAHERRTRTALRHLKRRAARRVKQRRRAWGRLDARALARAIQLQAFAELAGGHTRTPFTDHLASHVERVPFGGTK